MESSWPQDLSIVKNWSYQFQYEWIIANFSQIEGFRVSPVFEVKLDGNCTKWILMLYPTDIRICLILVDTEVNALGVDCEFIFLNTKDQEITRDVCSLSVLHQGIDLGCADFISRDILLKDISYDDHLRIIAQIRVSNSPNHLQSVFRDFTKLRSNRASSDVTITVRGREFFAHKLILSARSPVFSAMFQHDMKEALTGKVEIDDMEPEVFEEFLKYIYMEDINLDDNASELLAVANKYDVKDLKTRCEWALIKSINMENCFKLLSLSHLHTAVELKERTIDFIVSNDLRCEEDQNRLDEVEDSSLLKELIKALLKNK